MPTHKKYMKPTMRVRGRMNGKQTRNVRGMKGKQTKRVRKMKDMTGAPVGKKETWIGLVKRVHKEKKRNNKNWSFKDTLQSAKEIWKGVNKPVQQGARIYGGTAQDTQQDTEQFTLYKPRVQDTTNRQEYDVLDVDVDNNDDSKLNNNRLEERNTQIIPKLPDILKNSIQAYAYATLCRFNVLKISSNTPVYINDSGRQYEVCVFNEDVYLYAPLIEQSNNGDLFESLQKHKYLIYWSLDRTHPNDRLLEQQMVPMGKDEGNNAVQDKGEAVAKEEGDNPFQDTGIQYQSMGEAGTGTGGTKKRKYPPRRRTGKKPRRYRK